MASKPAPWADSPFSLISETGALHMTDIPKGHPAPMMARVMAEIHNALFRTLNSIYNQCLAVKPGSQDAVDFQKYCQFFHTSLHHHHHLEEEVFFPDLEKLAEKPGLMEVNVEQHKAFDEGLERFRSYVFETSPDDYDGEELKRIIDSFGKVLEQHLHDEIPTLLNLHHLDAAGVKKAWDKTDKAAQAWINFYSTGPWVLGSSDKTFKIDGVPDEFPPVPFFVPHVVNYITSSRHSGAWRFSPCTFYKTPKPLALVSDV